jgi:hypothetical protein
MSVKCQNFEFLCYSLALELQLPHFALIHYRLRPSLNDGSLIELFFYCPIARLTLNFLFVPLLLCSYGLHTQKPKRLPRSIITLSSSSSLAPLHYDSASTYPSLPLPPRLLNCRGFIPF